MCNESRLSAIPVFNPCSNPITKKAFAMIPHRSTPSPPAKLPPNHPFASYYIPPPTPGSPATIVSTTSYSTVPTSPSTSSHSARSYSPMASSATPHIPSTPLGLPHHGSSTSGRPAYTNLPAELGLFDNRPRQTLLSDIELIVGKKFHFPLFSRRAFRERDTEGEKNQKRVRSRDDGSNGRVKNLGEHNSVEDSARDGVKSANEGRSGNKGRGVKEGSWI